MNTQTAGFAVLLLDAAIALFSFFVVAPCVLNAVSLFGVQKQFARTMIDEGVISEEAVELALDSYREWLHQRSRCPGCGLDTVVDSTSGHQQVWTLDESDYGDAGSVHPRIDRETPR